MYCENCGDYIGSDFDYCISCGWSRTDGLRPTPVQFRLFAARPNTWLESDAAHAMDGDDSGESRGAAQPR